MTDADQEANWNYEVLAAMRCLTVEDMPSLEVLLIDGLSTLIFAQDNPGGDYGGDHGS